MGIADVGKWSDLGVTFLKAIYGLAPYVALASLLAVLTQSSAVSISTSLGYYVVELIATPLLGLNDTLEKLTDFILGSNVSDWMESAFVTVEVNGSGARPSSRTPFRPSSSSWPTLSCSPRSPSGYFSAGT